MPLHGSQSDPIAARVCLEPRYGYGASTAGMDFPDVAMVIVPDACQGQMFRTDPWLHVGVPIPMHGSLPSFPSTWKQ